MKSLRSKCTGRAPVHFYRRNCGLALALAAAVAPLSVAHAAPAPGNVAAVAISPTQSIDFFYRARSGVPLWLSASAGDSADQLLSFLSSASVDGLNADSYAVPALQQALQTARATGKKKDVDTADRMLSAAFVAYVSDLNQDPGLGILYVDPALKPKPPSPMVILLSAANAPSLAGYLRDMGWMNPIYAELRRALTDHQFSSERERALLAVNLERARVLPSGRQRYVLVNAAQQRLYMYDDRKQVDSMVVVVGKPKWQTPMMTAYIRFAALNPYWYVPPELVPEDIGQYVAKYGLKYFDNYGYQIVSDWTKDPTIIDPKTVDWKAVNDGKVQLMIRQKPGPKNFMGRMKFMFPNEAGVYLHDNPRRELFEKASRYYSGGCVRLEDAARLGRWLFGHDLDWQDAGTEQMVPLASPVPVYITYLTAMPSADGTSIAYSDDAYGRDKAALATVESSAGSAANASK